MHLSTHFQMKSLQKSTILPLEQPALAASLAEHFIVCHPLKKSSSERRHHLPFSLLIVFFLKRPLFPLPDGGSFSADSSTIRLLSRRVQQEERSARDARGARDLASRKAFSYPTRTGAIEAISKPDLALLQLTRRILR